MTRKAIFVGVDGAQLEKYLLLNLKGEAQTFNGLDIVESYIGGEEGTATQQATSSGPGWSTLLTGVWTDQHGITSNSDLPIAEDQLSLFDRVDAGIEDATIASIVNWSPINTGHFAEDMGFLDEDAKVDIEAHGLNDQAVTDTVVELIETVAPDFTFLHLDNVDGVGHGFGFGAEYDQSLRTVDQQIAEILAAVEAREAANPEEEWLVIVSTDHGRTGTTGTDHGGQSDSERRTFIAANVDLAHFDDPVPATSVTTTILNWLGIDFDLAADGLVSGSLLEGAADPLPPVLEEILSPVDDAARVAPGANLVFRFSETVVAGTGAVSIYSADGTLVESIDVTSARVTIAGDTVTVDPLGDLGYDGAYYVTIDSGAFTDGVNAYRGFTDASTWNFATESDIFAPELVSLAPADDAEQVAVDADLVLTFNETVVKGAGSVSIVRASDGSVVEVIDVASALVSVAGNTVTVNPSADLEPGTEYRLEVTPGAFRDTAARTTIYTQDFESITLTPFVSGTESGGDGTDWSNVLPEGFTQVIDIPTGGPVEFYGWTFLDVDSWTTSAGDQRRSEFTKGTGTVMVADPDEYDDGATDIDPTLWNAYISLPGIDLTGIEAGTATVTFDSSWRPEDAQEASLTVSYDGGPAIELLHWSSDPASPDFKDDDSVNEAITVALDNPAGAGLATLTFGVFNAGNDWWWAVDNILVQGAGGDGSTSGNSFAGISDWNFTTAEAVVATEVTLFAEDFEGLADDLGAFVSATEKNGDGTDWTATLPEGWSQTNDTPAGGPVEFYGWTFFDKASWIATSGNQGRDGFTKGQGVVMVADPDEYDDGAVDIDPTGFKAAIRTPEIDLTGVVAGSAKVSFDSSWLPEDAQTARLTVSFDGGPAVELFRWTSDPTDANFHADAPNEALTIDLDNPAGASTAVITFEMVEGGNDWWWAVDNIEVTALSTEADLPLTLTGSNARDTLTGGAADDVISGLGAADLLDGAAGDDHIRGGRGDDSLSGADGDDLLRGGLGNDIVSGGAGDDLVAGWAGDDVLTGGSGNDVLRGGEGSDRFVFAAGFGVDRIADFTDGADLLDFSGHDGVAGIGDLTFATVGGNAVILDAAGGLIVLSGVAVTSLGVEDFLFA